MKLCSCGCGEALPVGLYKGRERLFAHGHNRRRPLVERFWEKVDRRGPDECWPWLGATNENGYGRFWDGEKLRPAHQVAYEFGHGPIPKETEPHHTCSNPGCENPGHLEALTHRENLLASERVRETLARGRRLRWRAT